MSYCLSGFEFDLGDFGYQEADVFCEIDFPNDQSGFSLKVVDVVFWGDIKATQDFFLDYCNDPTNAVYAAIVEGIAEQLREESVHLGVSV